MYLQTAMGQCVAQGDYNTVTAHNPACEQIILAYLNIICCQISIEINGLSFYLIFLLEDMKKVFDFSTFQFFWRGLYQTNGESNTFAYHASLGNNAWRKVDTLFRDCYHAKSCLSKAFKKSCIQETLRALSPHDEILPC